ncbi:hypothetical protein BSKO_11747 [Bryopsis sp. KO-2023]|nr:hypothetical protein BSKO_11747 [Bryopsis sp. KO-2023]
MSTCGDVRIVLAQPVAVAVSTHSEVEVYLNIGDEPSKDVLEVVARKSDKLISSVGVECTRALEKHKIILPFNAPAEDCVLDIRIESQSATVSSNDVPLLVLPSLVAKQVNEIFMVCVRDSFNAKGKGSQSDVQTLIEAWENYFQYLVADLTSIILNPGKDDDQAYQVFCRVLRYFVLNKAYAPAQYVINLAIDAGQAVMLFGTPLTEKIDDLEALHTSIQASH